jgi:hypothetical protein
MPEVFADEDRHAAEAGIEGAHAIAAGEIPLLVEHPVGREINFAVDVAHFAALKVNGRVVKAIVGAFFHQPGDERNVAAEFFKALDLRRGELERDIGHHVAEKVARKTQLRKEHKVRALSLSEADLLLVQRKISAEISQPRIDLCKSDSERHGFCPLGVNREA